MLPAVATERQVTKQILIYTWLTVLATLALALATGWLYAAVAIVAGTWFLVMAHQLLRRRAARRAGQAAAAVPAVEQLPGRGVLRAGGRFGVESAHTVQRLSRRAASAVAATA